MDSDALRIQRALLTEPDRPFDWQDRVVLWGCILTGAAALLLSVVCA